MSDCYNPYRGIKFERDLKVKSEEESENLRQAYLRDISFDPRHILEDCYALFETVTRAQFSISQLWAPRTLKAMGFLLVMFLGVILMFTFLR